MHFNCPVLESALDLLMERCTVHFLPCCQSWVFCEVFDRGYSALCNIRPTTRWYCFANERCVSALTISIHQCATFAAGCSRVSTHLWQFSDSRRPDGHSKLIPNEFVRIQRSVFTVSGTMYSSTHPAALFRSSTLLRSGRSCLCLAFLLCVFVR